MRSNRRDSLPGGLRLMVAALLLVGLVGCGNTPDSLMTQQIAQMNELADAMEGGASEADLEAIGERIKETGQKIEAMKLSAAEKEALLKRHEAAAKEAMSRLVKASFTRMSNEIGSGKMPGLPKLDF